MAEQQQRHLTFVKTDDLELWRCRPIGTVPVMDLRDSTVGQVDGLILEIVEDRPLFLVVRRDGEPAQRFLVPSATRGSTTPSTRSGSTSHREAARFLHSIPKRSKDVPRGCGEVRRQRARPVLSAGWLSSGRYTQLRQVGRVSMSVLASTTGGHARAVSTGRRCESEIGHSLLVFHR